MGCCESETQGEQFDTSARRISQKLARDMRDADQGDDYMDNNFLEAKSIVFREEEPPLENAVFEEEEEHYVVIKPKIVHGYWKIRGVGEPIRYMLECINQPWEDVQYELGDAPDFSMDEWTSAKDELELDFPNIPYMIDGKTKLTNPFAIMKYLAYQYSPELAGETVEGKAEIEMLHEKIIDAKKVITGPCYVGENRQKLIGLAKKKLIPIVEYLGEKKFLVEDKLTLIDFMMLELCEFA